MKRLTSQQFLTWLWRMKRSGVTRRSRETTFGSANPQLTSDVQEDAPPPYTPPNDTVDLNSSGVPQLPINTNAIETVEILRGRNPVHRPPHDDSETLRPPLHASTPTEAATLAASHAVIGVIRALDEPHPRMVAARTAQAIAVSVSTSRSYGAFVAAVTAAESVSLMMSEAEREHSPPDRVRKRTDDVIDAAVAIAMAADVGITPIGPWPFSIHDSRP